MTLRAIVGKRALEDSTNSDDSLLYDNLDEMDPRSAFDERKVVERFSEIQNDLDREHRPRRGRGGSAKNRFTVLSRRWPAARASYHIVPLRACRFRTVQTLWCLLP
jgi:hypothetical protein